MQVWAVEVDLAQLPQEIYNRALLLVDSDSQTRIRRFYRREDAWRTLIGRLLPRVLLREHGVSVADMTFAATAAGKPYIAPGVIEPPLAFNITHDAGFVAMAFVPALPIHNPPEYRLGVDVMRVNLPLRDTLDTFIETFCDQLSATECSLLSPTNVVNSPRRLENFYKIWVLKEAYTKALGLGLGFDFSRISCDLPAGRMLVDGAILRGWDITTFVLEQSCGDWQGIHVAAVASYVGGEQETVVCEEINPPPDWVIRIEGHTFVERALRELV